MIKIGFDEMDKMSNEELIKLRDKSREDLIKVKQVRNNLMAEIMYLQSEIEKELNK